MISNTPYLQNHIPKRQNVKKIFVLNPMIHRGRKNTGRHRTSISNPVLLQRHHLEYPSQRSKLVPSSELAGAWDDSLLPIVLVQCHFYSDFLGGVEVSAIFLIRTHGHARHGHGVHVHLSHGTTAAIHVHHTVCCGVPLVGKRLLGKGAVPGQVS